MIALMIQLSLGGFTALGHLEAVSYLDAEVFHLLVITYCGNIPR
jgi:hypothetical protein